MVRTLQGGLPEVQDIGCDLLQLQIQVRRNGSLGFQKVMEFAEEIRRPKQMYADLSLKHEALKDIAGKEFYSKFGLAPRIRSNTTNADPAASPVRLRRKKEAFLMKIWSRSHVTKYLSKGKDPGC